MLLVLGEYMLKRPEWKERDAPNHISGLQEETRVSCHIPPCPCRRERAKWSGTLGESGGGYKEVRPLTTLPHV